MTLAADAQGNVITQAPDGSWHPADMTVHEQSGAKLVKDAADGQWHPLPGQGPTAGGAFARGAVQGATFGFSDEARAGVDALVQGGRNLIGGDGPGMGEAYDRSLEQSREQMRQDQLEHPYASGAGQVVGGIGSTMVGGEVLGAARLATGAGRLIANPIARAAATGATVGGVTGFGEGEGGFVNRATGAGEGAVAGGVLGAGIGGIERGISRGITPVRPTVSPEYGRLVGVLQNEGVTLTPGETTGSKPLKATETNLEQMPFAAGPAAEAADQKAVQINRAVLSRAGITGEDRITSDVLKNQTKNLGGQIDAIASANDMQVTPAFAQTIGDIRQQLPLMTTDGARQVEALTDRLRGMFTPGAGNNTIVPGQAYKNLLSDVTTAYTDATGEARKQLGNLRNILRQQMESSMPQADADKWRLLNRQYANLALIKDAMGGAGGGTAEGNISPAVIRGALDRSMGGDAYAMGYGDLNDLARAGQTVLRKPPDSGTGIRTYINQLLTLGAAHGGSGGIGATIGGALAGPPGAAVGGLAGTLFGPRMAQAAMNSRLGRAYLTNQLAPDLQTLARGVAGGVAEYAAPRNQVMLQ